MYFDKRDHSLLILTASQKTFGLPVALILCRARRSINFLVQISVRRVTIATYLSMNDRGKFSKKKTDGKYFLQTLQRGGIKSLARIFTGGGKRNEFAEWHVAWLGE